MSAPHKKNPCLVCGGYHDGQPHFPKRNWVWREVVVKVEEEVKEESP